VGFIQKLPTDLVAAFRATLEEITEADLIVHLVDASHPQAPEQVEAVEDELEVLGVDSGLCLTVLNKLDLVPEERLPIVRREVDAPIAVSALTGAGLDSLLACVQERIAAAFVRVQVTIPYAEAELVNLFRSRGMVDREDHRPEGTIIAGRLPKALLPSFRPFLT
ncbi:MAG: GTPase HflX, partial [Chloroflexi bacterium]|nr:GTPase HflX [Chloroflexota bacterium]